MVMNMARAVRLHGGEQLSKEAMNAKPLFPALVSTCLLSLAEPIYRDGRNLKVEYPPSPAPDGLQLAVADVTPPLPPFNVRVTSRGSGAMKTLGTPRPVLKVGLAGSSSCATIEGRPICCRPMTPNVVYGRPLFHGLSYNDTPEGPHPEIRYLDASAKPGEKHTYSILTVNSAGVPSEPSARVFVPSPESKKEKE